LDSSVNSKARLANKAAFKGLRAHNEGTPRMIGLVIVTHGRLADEFIHAMEHVVGKQKQVEAICIGPDDRMDQRRNDIAAAIARVETGHGVIVLTDMFGGTPSNLAISLLQDGKVEVVAGLNLPMLVKLARIRVECNLHKAANAAQDAGRKYINIASQVLGD
jgi:mannose PTS system EIIA component